MRSEASVRRVLSLAAGRPTLIDRLVERGALTDCYLVIAGAALMSVLAHVSIPSMPVAITGQVLGMLLTGAVLGAHRAGLAMVLYLALGISGLPVFSQGASGLDYLLGPTGGFLLAFLVSSIVVGAFAQRARRPDPRAVLADFLVAGIIVFAVGAPWYGLARGLDPVQTVTAAILSYLPGAAVAAGAATVLVTIGWRSVLRDDRLRAVEATSLA